MRHPTAAEQMFGTTGGNCRRRLQVPVVTVTEPVVVASPAPQPAPQPLPQPVSRMAPSDATFAQQGPVLQRGRGRAGAHRLCPGAIAGGPRLCPPDADRPSRDGDQARQFRAGARLSGGLARSSRTRPAPSSACARWTAPPSTAPTWTRWSTAHEKALATLETQASSGRETASIASAVVPTVRHHLEMARALDARL